MKKIFRLMMATAIALGTFTACEDVPEPYTNPYEQGASDDNGGGTVVIEPAGSGTLADPYNVAGVLEYVNGLGADVTSSGDVYIKGVITSITESFGTQYGNATFVISDTEDATNKFTFYRGLYLGNVKFTDTNATNIKEGDEVIICGKVVNYKGTTPETSQGNAYVYSINGVGGGGSTTPDVKVVGSADNPQTIAQAIAVINALENGATTEEFYYVKGTISKINTTGENVAKYKNINYVISDGGQDLTIYQGRNLDNSDFTKDGEINVGDEVVVYGQLQKYVNTSGAVTPEVAKGNYIVKLNADGSTPSTGGTGSGTQADPYNAVAANAYVASLPADQESSQDFYIKGKIVKFANNGQFSTQYGNASFYISDDGKDENTFYVFRTLYLGNVKYTEGTLPKEGDEVIICGKVVNYKGNTPETSANNSYIYSLNGQTTAGGGGSTTNAGTKDSPFTVAQAIAKCEETGETATSTEFYAKGKIKSIKEVSTSYGNATFDITDDGNNAITVFRAYSLENQKFTAEDEIKVGDEVIVVGKLVNYKGNTPEFTQGCYIYSLNGKTSASSSGGSTGGGSTLTVTMESLGLANATDLNTQTLSDGTTLTFSAEANTNAPKYYTTGAAARVYAQNSLTIKASKAITKVVLNCVATYVGNTQIYGEADGKKVTVKQEDPTVTFSDFSSQTLKIVNDYTEAKAGTQLRIVSIELTYAN